MSVNVVVSGSGGRMGGAVARKVLQTPGFELIAALESPDSPLLGQDPGIILGYGPTDLKFITTEDYFKDPQPCVFADFTNPETCVTLAKKAMQTKHDVVIGTTGLSTDQILEIAKTASKTKQGCLISPNFSVGVNVFWNAAVKLTELLRGYDIEIIEAHHRLKKDAPSGTAKMTANLIANSLNTDEGSFVYGRSGGDCLRKDPDKEIGVLALRAGDIFGDHTVLYAGNSERIELKHQLHSRDALASGVLLAAKWIGDHRDGNVYGMKEVLGL